MILSTHFEVHFRVLNFSITYNTQVFHWDQLIYRVGRISEENQRIIVPLRTNIIRMKNLTRLVFEKFSTKISSTLYRKTWRQINRGHFPNFSYVTRKLKNFHLSYFFHNREPVFSILNQLINFRPLTVFERFMVNFLSEKIKSELFRTLDINSGGFTQLSKASCL